MPVENLVTEQLDIWTSALKTKSGVGRGNSKKLELVGIKKLRELILELAVRGKLVPQDLNDEPASELLKKIELEKAKLVQDKKIKKQKKMPPIQDEGPFDIPNGWTFSHLCELVTLLGDGLHGTPSYDSNGDYFFVNGNNLSNGNIIIKSETKRVDIEQYVKYKKELNSRTIFVSINGTLGNVAFYNDEPIILGKSACYFNLVSKLSKKFFKVLIESPHFIKYAHARATGSTIKNLGLKAMNELIVPLPPINEQKRIVNKVDELMALCDQLERQTESSIQAHQLLVETLLTTLNSAKNSDELSDNWQRISQYFDVLFTTQGSIEKLKQTIMQLAFMGKLVKQDPNDEPASELLSRIVSEKELLVKNGKIKKQKPLSFDFSDEKRFQLPNGWEWTCLGQISEIAPRNSLDEDLAVSFVPMPMVSTSYKGEHEQEIRKWGEIKKGYTHFAEGDIGLAKITPCFENSKAAIFQNLKNGFGAGTTELHIARPIPSTINPLFVLLYLKAPLFLEKGKTKMTGSAGQKRVPTQFFINNPLPLAPLEEQSRIVAKVEELMTICDSIQITVAENQTAQLKLSSSIISQALKKE